MLFEGLRSIIKKDKLIQEFAKHLIQRLGLPEERRPSDINNIRNKLRSLARLVKLLQPPTAGIFVELSRFIAPQHFDSVIAASRDMAISSPQLGLALGHYLKQTVMQKIALAIKGREPIDLKDAEDFERLLSAI